MTMKSDGFIAHLRWYGRDFSPLIERIWMNFLCFFQYHFQWEIVEFYSSTILCCICGFSLRFFFHSHHLPRLPLIFSIIITVIVPISTFLRFSSWIHLIKDYCKLLFDDVIFLYFTLFFYKHCHFVQVFWHCGLFWCLNSKVLLIFCVFC